MREKSNHGNTFHAGPAAWDLTQDLLNAIIVALCESLDHVKLILDLNQLSYLDHSGEPGCYNQSSPLLITHYKLKLQACMVCARLCDRIVRYVARVNHSCMQVRHPESHY